MKKNQNLENGEFYEKSALNKKDVKFDFTLDMFYKISCIFNHIIFIIGSYFPKKQLWANIMQNAGIFARDLGAKSFLKGP